MAIDYQMITWSVDGWRDDTFTALVVFSAWGFLRLRNQPSFGNAVVAGLAAGAACLTRITALSFILPALLWLVIDGARPLWRERARHASTALLILAALVAPYLISCAIGTGDPLIAINYHTIYYRARRRPRRSRADERPRGTSVSRFARHPLATMDIGVTGLFVQPFITESGRPRHLAEESSRPALWWLALAGLVALPFSAAGRLLLVILLCSLLPYAFTWNLGGSGGEWRFTMHAYPLYIVAAMLRAGRRLSRGGGRRAGPVTRKASRPSSRSPRARRQSSRLPRSRPPGTPRCPGS